MTRTVLGFRVSDNIAAPDYKPKKLKRRPTGKRAAAKKGRPFIYPYALIEVGESFFIPGPTRSNGISAAANRHRDRQFTVRHVTHRNAEGVRVWRVQ